MTPRLISSRGAVFVLPINASVDSSADNQCSGGDGLRTARAAFPAHSIASLV